MLGRCLVATVIVLLGIGSATAGVEAAPPPTSDGVVSVTLDGPPGAPEAVQVVVSVGDIDITNRCTDEALPDDGRRIVTCADLQDGVYAVEILDVADGSVVFGECYDIVAARGELGVLQIGNGFTQWDCFVTVGPPSILLTAGLRDPFDPVVVDGSGTPVNCVRDDLGFEQRLWCDAAIGDYRIDVESIDPAFRDDLECGFDDGVAFERIQVTSETPFVTCQQSEVFGLSIDVGWIGLETETAPWFDGVQLSIVDESGEIVGVTCEESEHADGPGLRRVLFSCFPGIGMFDVDVLDVPDGLQLSVAQIGDVGVGICGVLTTSPSEQGICILRFETPASVARSADPDEPDPADELPATGSYDGPLALIGLGLLGAGVAMVVGTRRRDHLVVR